MVLPPHAAGGTTGKAALLTFPSELLEPLGRAFDLALIGIPELVGPRDTLFDNARAARPRGLGSFSNLRPLLSSLGESQTIFFPRRFFLFLPVGTKGRLTVSSFSETASR